MPTSDERNTSTSGATGKTGRVSDFERGHIHWWTGAPQAFETHGAIDALYMSMGGAGSWLGFPTSDEYTASTGRARSDFEGGFITTSDGINYQAVRNNCSYSLTFSSQSFSASGGSGSVGVNAISGCPWTAVSNSSFITVTSGANGSGNGTVNYSVAANTSTSQRSGSITIAGRTFSVTQSGASCSYNINPSAQNFAATGGGSSVGVTAGSGCSWSAASNSGFITITSGSSGSGNGSVGYSVAAHTGGQRSGTMTIAGRTFNVTQDTATITGHKAEMTSPVNGSTLLSGPVTFNWTSGSGASGYWLFLGTSAGAADLYNQDQGTSVSRTVSGLPMDGREIHATLWSFVSSLGGWVHNQYMYKTPGTVSKAQMISPANGSTFNSGTVTFNWNTGSGASGYWLYLGTSAGAADLYNQNQGTGLSRTISGLPTDGRPIYATLWSYISSMGGWVYNQYDYKAFGGGVCTYTINPSSHNFGANGGGSSVSVTAGSGCGWSAVSNSGFITVTSGSNGSGNGTVGYSVASNNGASRTGTITVAGKPFTVTQDAVNIVGKSEMISPPNGATFNSGTVTFTWTSGAATSYWLYLGNSPGSADLYNQDQGTNLSRTVSGLPTDGRRIYATLWSFVSSMGGWVTNQYTYTAAVASGGSTGSGYSLSAPTKASPGSVITVNWTAPSGHSANDWVGLYRTGSPDTSFISFQYISSATSGTLNFVAPGTEGVYEFRSFVALPLKSNFGLGHSQYRER